jgi:DNA polymerase-3 subunit epsilon
MKLALTNPIVFFDLETTGTNIISDRIVEICYLKVMPNGNETMRTLRINPEMHIPEEASAVHGIYDQDVADCPTFKEVAKEIANDFKGSDIAGFNSNRFDVPLLAEEFLRVLRFATQFRKSLIETLVTSVEFPKNSKNFNKSFLYATTEFSDNPRTDDKYNKNSSTRFFNEVLVDFCIYITQQILQQIRPLKNVSSHNLD